MKCPSVPADRRSAVEGVKKGSARRLPDFIQLLRFALHDLRETGRCGHEDERDTDDERGKRGGVTEWLPGGAAGWAKGGEKAEFRYTLPECADSPASGLSVVVQGVGALHGACHMGVRPLSGFVRYFTRMPGIAPLSGDRR